MRTAKHIFFFLLIGIIGTNNSFSQNLESNLNSLDSLIQKGKYFSGKNKDSSLFYLNKALHRCEETNNKKKYASVEISIHFVYLKNAEYDIAEKHLISALYSYESIDNKKGITLVNNKLGWLYILKGNYGDAIIYANKALQNENISSFEKSSAYNTSAAAYQYLGDYQKALKLYYKALESFEKENSKKGIATMYNNMAAIYNAMGENTKALDLYKKSEKLFLEIGNEMTRPSCLSNIGSVYLLESQYDSAEYYFKEAYKLHSENNNKIEIARVQSNMGQLYLNNKLFVKAEVSIQAAIDIFKATKNGTNLSICHILRADLLFQKGSIKEAISEIKTSLVYATSATSNNQTIECYEKLAKYYGESKKSDSAFHFLKLHTLLKDSLFTIEKAKALDNLAIVYETEKKERKIELLEKDKEIRSFRTYILGIIVLIVIILSLAGFYVFALRIKSSKQKLSLLNEEQKAKQLHLDKNKLLLEKQNLENEKLKTDIGFKEKELATNAMYLIQTNESKIKTVEQLLLLKNQLEKEQTTERKQISDIIQQIALRENTDIWAEFELRFTQVHKKFYIHLNEKYPNMTPNEKKLCAFLRLNMSTKEISMVTHQSPNSIRVARTRLRKKLDIGSDENLMNFLISI